MKSWFGRALVSAGLVVALTVPTGVAAAATPAQPADTPVSAAAVQWYWEWSDGSMAVRREFSERRYGYASNLPFLKVTNDACLYGIKVKLQFKVRGSSTWYDEDVARTKGCKAVKLKFWPYTSTGKWVRATYKYRVILSGSGGISQYFTIIYTR